MGREGIKNAETCDEASSNRFESIKMFPEPGRGRSVRQKLHGKLICESETGKLAIQSEAEEAWCISFSCAALLWEAYSRDSTDNF